MVLILEVLFVDAWTFHEKVVKEEEKRFFHFFADYPFSAVDLSLANKFQPFLVHYNIVSCYISSVQWREM